MAEEFWVVWDMQHAGQGYDGVAGKKVFKKGETLTSQELASAGMSGKVFQAKAAKISAENATEACEIAAEAYGDRGGIAGAAKVANLKFESL